MEYTVERNDAFSDADIERINELYVWLDRDKPTAQTTDHARIASVFASGNTVIIARDRASGEIVGMATLTLTPKMSGQVAVIHDVVTLPSVRGRGIASDLVSDLVEEAARRGLSRVELTSHPRRDTERFYTRLGFEKYDTEHYRMFPL